MGMELLLVTHFMSATQSIDGRIRELHVKLLTEIMCKKTGENCLKKTNIKKRHFSTAFQLLLERL